MYLEILAVVAGLVWLLKGADLFVEGASSLAQIFGVPAILIGMLIIGFGTSMPEMVVSGIAAVDGIPGIALGNAYGSNIMNIGLILGTTAVIKPIMIHSKILRVELPVLIFVTLIPIVQLWDGYISQTEGFTLLGVFFVIIGLAVFKGLKTGEDSLATDYETESQNRELSKPKAGIFLLIGLVSLAISSKILVWGASEIARSLGVSDLIIGLTVIALGTSLPELASSVVAARKGENDLALGNIIGSNIFNTLAVVGIAGSIHPIEADAGILQRDISVMIALTFLVFIMGLGYFKKEGRINRYEGGLLLLIFSGYMGYLMYDVLSFL